MAAPSPRFLPDPAKGLRLEDAPAAVLELVTAIHARYGAGDGVVSARAAQAFLATADAASRAQVQAVLGAWPADGEAFLLLARPPLPPAPPAVPPGSSAAAPVQADPPAAAPVLPIPLDLNEATVDGAPPDMAPGEEDTLPPDTLPCRLDAQGKVWLAGSSQPLDVGSAEMGRGLSAMAVAVELGRAEGLGVVDAAAQRRLVDAAEEAAEESLRQAPTRDLATAPALRLRAAAASVAAALARRSTDGEVRHRATDFLARLLRVEPRRSMKAALAAALAPLEGTSAAVDAALAEELARLQPPAPPYAAWHAQRPQTEPLAVRHWVHAREHRRIRDGYEAAGFERVSDRPLLLERAYPGARRVRVELKRSPTALVLGATREPAEVLLLTGLALTLEIAPPAPCPRLVVGCFRRDPFGVPRFPDRFPDDHLLAAARGDGPLDDVAFHLALLESLARGHAYADAREACMAAAPQLSARALWPHETAALRAAGGAPAPFARRPGTPRPHHPTWAVPRAPLRPVDLVLRPGVPPDETSTLALEVAVGLAGATLHGEDLPVLEPGGFNAGASDILVQPGPVFWRVGAAECLGHQSEEALAALVTLRVHTRRAQVALDQPERVATLLAATRMAEVLAHHCATRDVARGIARAVVRRAGMPEALDLDTLWDAARDAQALGDVVRRHAAWLEGAPTP